MNGISDLKLLNRSVFSTFKTLALGIGLFSSCLTGHAAFGFHDNEKPDRAQDLSYGAVLYEYYQGKAFEALSLLNVAKEKGGINGHGDHPDLVEGGLLLSYGMTREAKAIFENLLQEKLSIKDQNTAWFYLGKVFYLEHNYAEALASFNKINSQILKTHDPEKLYELIYIQSQIGFYGSAEQDSAQVMRHNSDTSVNALPKQHILSYYLRYNQSVALLNGARKEPAMASFSSLINALEQSRENGEWQNNKEKNINVEVPLAKEFKALYNQSLLSLGQLYIQSSQNELAFNTLKKVDKNSPFSNQALFAYAIAASHLQHYELALSALNAINEQTTLNPWQQQTPYALAYLYEQLNEPILALEAYRAAVAQYEALQEELKQERESLTEEKLLDALKIKNSIGSEALSKDAYGRVLTPKQRFSFSKLLTTEKFQRQLSELHELYLLKNSMHRWASQLDSFEDMLDTRLLSRQQKLHATKEKLTLQEVDQWLNKERLFKQAINDAIANDDAYFFMSDEQLGYFKRLQKAQERLDTLPNDHKKKSEYTERFRRAKAYFDWWVHDQFTVNRWRTVKELRDLQTEMSLFRKQHKLLDAEQELDDKHIRFVNRVNKGKERQKEGELKGNKKYKARGHRGKR